MNDTLDHLEKAVENRLSLVKGMRFGEAKRKLRIDERPANLHQRVLALINEEALRRLCDEADSMMV